MKNEVKQYIEEFLKENYDVKVYFVAKMKGIYPEVIIDRQNIKKEAKPMKQKKKSFTLERQEIIKEEVHKLIDTRFISEVINIEMDHQRGTSQED